MQGNKPKLKVKNIGLYISRARNFKSTLGLTHFWIKLTQIEKAGSIGQIFIPLGSENKFHFRDLKSNKFFKTFTLS